MARFIFRLPDIGEGIAEAEIVAWHVKVGDTVEEDGRLADMMTDKATVEMESPVAGTVVEVAGDVGDVVAIGSPLVVIETEDAGDAAKQLPDQVTVGEAPPVVASPPEPARPPEAVNAPEPEPPAPPAAPLERSERPPNHPHSAAKVLASPAVRQRARELGIDLSEVRPSEQGRIRHSDLDQFVAYNAQGGYRAAGEERGDEVIRIVGLRRRIAENMVAAKRHIPHFTYVEECDVTALEDMRAQLNAASAERPKLTLLPFLVMAICRSVPQFPMINARYDDEAGLCTRYGAVHLGMATRTAAGLMVPVIRNAQALNLWQLASEIARLADAARNGSIRSEELSGSTLSITSLGPLGGIAATPIINRPEVAIVGPNRIVERPMFVPDGLGGERIAKRKLMNLSISCDHRVVDGWDAASFVRQVKLLLEAPALLLAG